MPPLFHRQRLAARDIFIFAATDRHYRRRRHFARDTLISIAYAFRR